MERLIIGDIKERLKCFGYDLLDSDKFAIEFIIEKVENEIRNECNIEEIPDELYQFEIDRICGEFLFAKKESGQMSEFQFELIEKQIQNGDTSVTYATEVCQTPEQNFDKLLNCLVNSGNSEFASFRCLKW